MYYIYIILEVSKRHKGTQRHAISKVLHGKLLKNYFEKNVPLRAFVPFTNYVVVHIRVRTITIVIVLTLIWTTTEYC